MRSFPLLIIHSARSFRDSTKNSPVQTFVEYAAISLSRVVLGSSVAEFILAAGCYAATYVRKTSCRSPMDYRPFAVLQTGMAQ